VGRHPTSCASPGGGAGASPVLALGSVASEGRPVTASLPPRRGKLIGAAAPWPDPPTRKGMTVASRRVTSPGLLVDPGTQALYWTNPVHIHRDGAIARPAHAPSGCRARRVAPGVQGQAYVGSAAHLHGQPRHHAARSARVGGHVALHAGRLR